MIHHKPHVWFLYQRPKKSITIGPPQNPLFLPPLYNTFLLFFLFSLTSILIHHLKIPHLAFSFQIRKGRKKALIILCLLQCLISKQREVKTHFFFFAQEIRSRRRMKFIGRDHHQSIGVSKRRVLGKRVGALLKEGRGRFYIFRRCIILLLCSHDQVSLLVHISCK